VHLLAGPGLEGLAAALPCPEAQQALAEAAPEAVLVAPLAARGHTLGVLVLAQAAGRRFTAADVALAEELARRVSVVLDNTRLFAEIQALNVELEQRVAERNCGSSPPGPRTRAK
jgi:GAF domain-containing protein